MRCLERYLKRRAGRVLERCRLRRRSKTCQRQRLKPIAGDERGSVLIITTVIMVGIIGMVALTIDGGHLYFRHTRLQDIADSAALAAAAKLVETPGDEYEKRREALGAAVRYSELNGLKAGVVDCSMGGYTVGISDGEETGRMTISFSNSLDQIEVQISLDVRSYFARVFSVSFTPVSVKAVVRIGQAKFQKGNLLPVAFFWGDYEPYKLYTLTLSPGSGQKGNYGFLDYKPSNMFREYMTDGYDGTLSVGDVIETFPGVKTGQVRQAIQERISRCRDGCSVSYSGGKVDVNIMPGCPRVVMVPIVSGFFEQQGRGYVTIRGFAKFFIESYDDDAKILTGCFLQEAVSTEFAPGTSGFTTQAIRLVK
ncbi:MAG TPA: hypothetical protein GXX30_00040 [Firmicutes bacterium]|nr:hypothetical protein [Candidatus Fermentithermobacillaceae bacterium]